MRRSTFIFILLPVLSLALIVEGCVVLNPVGDVISDGYENMLTYFNAYYNAKRAFDLAETDIHDAAKKAEGSTTPGAPSPGIPASASKNLDLVIDKCSNILAYHGKSSFVDDALMMTGKAFYYKGEYSKAERKFLELITQYPNSSLNLEAQLWYARSEEKLNEYDQARNNATALVAAAEQGGDRDILAQAYSLLGSLFVHNGSTASAIESYQNAEKSADSDELKADAWYRIGRLYFDDGQYENSVHALLEVDYYSDDVYRIFQSKLLATQAYRKLRFLDKALALEGEMEEDYRFKDFLGPVLLERATILLDGKQFDDAINIFQALDTTYARTETGATADFELGKYFEQVTGDYQKAKEYYRRATTVPSSTILEQSARKVIALNLYFTDLKDLSAADSVLSQATRADTTGFVPDSLAISAKDSSAVKQDSAKLARDQGRDQLNVDSLNAIRARAAAGLGELFYTDLANPDSAIHWLKYSLRRQYVESSAPRILYILSGLAASYPDKTTVSPKEYEDQIVRDFPNSYFAKQILHQDTVKVDQTVVDSAGIAYNAAEGLIEAHKNEEALAALEGIITRYPTSPVVAKCRYSIGWLYENRMAQMDSAAAEYKMLIAQYPATPYAQAVSQRQLDTLSTITAKPDTAISVPVVKPQKEDKREPGKAVGVPTKQNLQKPPGTLSRRARILQSQHGKPRERE